MKFSAHFEYFACHFDPSSRHRVFETKKKNMNYDDCDFDVDNDGFGAFTARRKTIGQRE